MNLFQAISVDKIEYMFYNARSARIFVDDIFSADIAPEGEGPRRGEEILTTYSFVTEIFEASGEVCHPALPPTPFQHTVPAFFRPTVSLVFVLSSEANHAKE